MVFSHPEAPKTITFHPQAGDLQDSVEVSPGVAVLLHVFEVYFYKLIQVRRLYTETTPPTTAAPAMHAVIALADALPALAPDWLSLESAFTHAFGAIYTEPRELSRMVGVIRYAKNEISEKLTGVTSAYVGLLVNDLNRTHADTVKEALEETVENAETMDAALQQKVLEMVSSPFAQAFKTSFKLFHVVRHTPEQVFNDLRKIFTPTCMPENPMRVYVSSSAFKEVEKQYALMAIAQSSMKPCRSDADSRETFLEQARTCDAVQHSTLIPQKFRLLLNGTIRFPGTTQQPSPST